MLLYWRMMRPLRYRQRAGLAHCQCPDGADAPCQTQWKTLLIGCSTGSGFCGTAGTFDRDAKIPECGKETVLQALFVAGSQRAKAQPSVRRWTSVAHRRRKIAFVNLNFLVCAPKLWPMRIGTRSKNLRSGACCIPVLLRFDWAPHLSCCFGCLWELLRLPRYPNRIPYF